MDLDEILDVDHEQAVLVAALRGLRPLPEAPDELRLAALASWHRVEGLLASAAPRDATFSDDLVDHLREVRDATEARWLHLRDTLAELVDQWDRAGIRTVALKGAALVAAGIVPAGERPMADVDVLVDGSRADEAHAIARRAGWQADHGDRVYEYTRTRHHHLPALVDGSGTMVEVHHRLLDRSHPRRRLDDLVRGRTVALPELDAHRLDDIAMWLHLAVHFWDDRRRGTGGVLLQLRDLDLLLQRIDPEELATVAFRGESVPLVGAVGATLDEVVPTPASAVLRGVMAGPPSSDPMLGAYLRRRVFGRRTALPQLLHPTGDVAYSPWRILTRARRQLWPPRRDLVRVLGADAGRRAHLSSLAPVVRDALADPHTTWGDIVVDRWAQNGTRVPVPPRG